MQIVTVGTPVEDFVVHVSAQYLAEHVGEVESFGEVKELSVFQEKVKQLPTPAKECPGGSALNTANALQGLRKNRCRHFGVIGSDELGKRFLQELARRGIDSKLQIVDGETAQAICYVTPGGNRTFRNFLGVSHAMSDLKIDPEMFVGCDLVHFDGYTILFEGLCEKVMKIAKEKRVAVSMNMPAFTIVAKHKDELLNLISKNVDVVIANKKEAEILTGKGPEEACRELQKLCHTAVVTTGKEGGFVANADGVIHFDSIPTEVVDTVGAGDWFAAGFLHLWLRKRPSKECADLGAVLASEVIKIVGADLPPEKIRQVMD